jgi:hypothetical protein
MSNGGLTVNYELKETWEEAGTTQIFLNKLNKRRRRRRKRRRKRRRERKRRNIS